MAWLKIVRRICTSQTVSLPHEVGTIIPSFVPGNVCIVSHSPRLGNEKLYELLHVNIQAILQHDYKCIYIHYSRKSVYVYTWLQKRPTAELEEPNKSLDVFRFINLSYLFFFKGELWLIDTNLAKLCSLNSIMSFIDYIQILNICNTENTYLYSAKFAASYHRCIWLLDIFLRSHIMGLGHEIGR